MQNPAIAAYRKSVIENFAFLKAAKDIQAAFLRAIPIRDAGFLLPVCEAHMDDAELLGKLAEWRNRHVDVFPTQFVATLESTRAWLANKVLGVADRMLFLVMDKQGKVAGHLGFSGCLNDEMRFEIDNVIRGEALAAKGLFSLALHALMGWAEKTLNVDGFFLRVMGDNTHAIDFYRRNGFVEERWIALAKEQKEDFVRYKEAGEGEAVDQYFVSMVWQPRRDPPGNALILTAGPSISAREAVYAFDAAVNGWNGNWSKYLGEFEKRFAEYVGAKYAIATSSCTGALQIALMALEIGPGDEVIVPDQTWVATANAVRYVGATPVFADSEPDTWNMDAASVEALVTDRTRAIIPVHMYGHPARMSRLLAVAERYGLKVIEDAAPAIGAEWQGRRCGAFGHFAAFSFQGAKLMVTGEGGMLVTSDDALYQIALKIWDQGRNPARQFWIDADGVKFKMSNIQAALGLGQLERIDELIEMKRRIFSWYREGLAGLPGIRLNEEVEGARSIYWMSSILLEDDAPIERDALMQQLKARNVDSRPVFPAISQYPIWRRPFEPQPNALRIGRRALNLPSGVCLKRDEVMYVCRQVRECLGA